MLPNNNILHLNDLKTDNSAKKNQTTAPYQNNQQKTSTTTTTTSNSQSNKQQQQQQQQQQPPPPPPIPITPNNLFTYNNSPKVYNNTPNFKSNSSTTTTPAKPTVVLEEIITDDENEIEYDNIEDQDNESPLTPSKRSTKTKTPRRWRLVPATCTCAVHDDSKSSVNCPRCNFDTSRYDNNGGNPQSHNQQQQYRHSQSQPQPQSYHQQFSNNNDYFGSNMFNTGATTSANSRSRVNFDSNPNYQSFYHYNYNVIPTGNTEQELNLLRTEIDHLEDQMKSNGLNSSIKPPITVSTSSKVNKVYQSGVTPFPSNINILPTTTTSNFNIPPNIPGYSTSTFNTSPNTQTQQPIPSPLKPIETQMNEIIQQLKWKEEEIQRLNRVINKKENEIKETVDIKDTEFSELRDQFQHSVVDFETLHDLQKEINSIRYEVDVLHDKDNEVSRKGKDIDRLPSDISNQERAQYLLNEIGNLRNHITSLDRVSIDKSQRLHQDQQRLNMELDSKNRELDQYKHSIQQYKKLLEQKDHSILSQNQLIDNLETEKNELFRVQLILDGRVKECENEIHQKNDIHTRKLNEMTGMLQEYQDLIEKLERENYDMKERLSKVHFIIQDSPRRLLSVEEIKGLTPIKQQNQQQVNYNNIINNIPQNVISPFHPTPNFRGTNLLNDLKVIRPNQSSQQPQPPLNSSPYNHVIRTNSPQKIQTPIRQQQVQTPIRQQVQTPIRQQIPNISNSSNDMEVKRETTTNNTDDVNNHNHDEQNDDNETNTYEIEYDDTNDGVTQKNTSNLQVNTDSNHNHDEQNYVNEINNFEKEDTDDNYEIEYDNDTDDIIQKNQPVTIKDDSYDNRIEEEEIEDNNNISPKSVFSTPSSVNMNLETPNGKSIESYKEKEESDDGWLSPGFNKSNNLFNNFTKSKKPTTTTTTSTFSKFNYYGQLPLLSSEEAKSNVLPQNSLLDNGFIAEPKEKSLYDYINNSRVKNLLPSNFSRLGGGMYKYGRHKIQISNNNNIPSVIIGKSTYEPFETFVEQFNSYLTPSHK